MYYFIVNPMSKSGRGLSTWNNVKQELDSRHTEYTYFITTHHGHATKFAKSICNDNQKSLSEGEYLYIIAVGGDGTVNEIVNGIDDYSNIVLGYIPSGSGNDLARGLGIDHDPLKALDTILDNHELMLVDHGYLKLLDKPSASIRKFCTSTGIGLDASICNDAINSGFKNALNKFHLGKLTYLLITLKQLFTIRFTDLILTVDGEKKSYSKMAFCASMIQKCEGGGLKLAPKAKFNDQKLSVCLVHGMSRLKILFMLPTLFFGKHSSVNGIDVFECSSIEIKTKKKLIMHVDGEYAGHSSHIYVQCIPTQVMMPKTDINN